MKKADILDLRPTQLAIGMLEVRMVLEKHKHLKGEKLKKIVKASKIQVAVAPNGALYIVDGHHHTMVFFLLGVKKVHIEVVEDFTRSGLSYKAFWKKMRERRWTHLYDQFGKGPHEPIYLPEDIRGLGDDPYRSLAWLVKHQGGYMKTTSPYSEFRWANFFREHRLLHCRYGRDYEPALKKAKKLARSAAAKKLPGYIKD